MPGESDANSSNVINSGDVSEVDQEVITQSLRLLLAQLVASGQETDSPYVRTTQAMWMQHANDTILAMPIIRIPFPTNFQALEALTTICKEIEAGADQLVAEHSRKRNQFLSIHQLPPEILVTVISAALSSDEYSRKNHTTTYLHRQKELRLVCARWNELIKATPSHKTVGNHYLGHHLLCQQQTKGSVPDFCGGDGERHFACVRAASAKVAWHNGRLFHAPTTFRLPGRSSIKLREIHLDDFMVPWEWPTLPSLTHLELRSIREGPTVAQVLDIISRAPRLKSCIIHQVRIQPLAETASESAPLEANQLRNVQFDSVRLDSVVQILNNLRLSRGCVIEVAANHHDSSFRPFLDYVRRRLPEIEDPTRKWTTSASIDITLSPEIIIAFPNHEWELRLTLIDQRWEDTEIKWQAYRQVLEEARSAFLHVDGDPGLLKSNETRTQITDGDADQDAPRQWMFPNLQKLHLYGHPSLNGILELVEARMNNPEVKLIISLVIDNSVAPEDVRKKLKELVAYVEFREI
ncbi:hypothetical protein FS837_009231 [Tulasnella sp. UAMH 9824]|nr:hypothetical protein FS837_009231 [Tulasnella sp. UAMH 9824]